MDIGTVFLVGAGPGHPGLATVRAVECLRRADVVIYDKLVSPLLLEHAPRSARRMCVTEFGDCHARRPGPVQQAMIEEARQGRCVVRLKGGDPFVFGRGGEEAQALRAAGIPCEIVPGVTAAVGAAAFAGIPLSDRRLASAVAFVTGHEKAETEGTLDWAGLARFPGTLVIYMGIARLQRIVASLIEHGKAPDAPAALVQSATMGEQRTLEAPLARLPEIVSAAGISSPAVVIIGDVVSLRQELAWFERKPLFGKRVLVTRPRGQAAGLVSRLVELGAVPLLMPAAEIREPDDWRPVDQALDRLASYQWLVFTSANGVHAFLGRLRGRGRDLRALGAIRLAAIGPKTAAALRQYHLEPDVVPEKYQSEDLAAALKAEIKPGQGVLLARADRGRELLREELSQIADVEQIAVYSQVDAVESAPEILDAMRGGEVDFVPLTSSNIARSLIRRLDKACRQQISSGRTRLVSISPVTSAEIRNLGLPVAAEATEATEEGLLAALCLLTSPSP